MNYARVGLAALAVWAAWFALGFLIHGVMLADVWEGLYRDGAIRTEAMTRTVMPVGVGLALVGSLVFSYAYAKGYEGGPGMQEGLRFGVLVGLLLVAFGVGWSYVTFPVPLEFLTWMSVAMVIQFAALGMVAGLVYRKRR
ncbi:MAG: hypothetical protein M3Q55_04370 [Acidobacteriota bacterium]|nr:hypothetical protein [Acidobacteriota bacterium]